MFEVITQSQPNDYQSLEILKEAYSKLSRNKEAVQTSKRIAQAYVLLGQLSSAILEYETILQRFPDDPDVKAALLEIESKANSLNAAPVTDTYLTSTKTSVTGKGGKTTDVVDDGRHAMYKIFVESKAIAAGDFDLCWTTPSLNGPPERVTEPFIQLLADKAILPLEKSLKLLLEKSRLGFMPLEKYDVDIELARSFPRDTCVRWCVLPLDRMSKTVLVATANPFNQQAGKELAAATQQRLLFYLSPPQDLMKAVKKTYR